VDSGAPVYPVLLIRSPGLREVKKMGIVTGAVGAYLEPWPFFCGNNRVTPVDKQLYQVCMIFSPSWCPLFFGSIWSLVGVLPVLILF